MEEGFVKADSNNLPNICEFMVARYFATNANLSAEMKGVKMQRSGRANYGDNAIGYVQIKREESICTMQCKVCPEHRVRSMNYKVQLKLCEQKQEILELKCHDCAASEGGCKHAIAFLMWAHRRAAEASPTETVCYWKKLNLSKVGSHQKFLKAKALGQVEECRVEIQKDSVLLEFLAQANKANGNSVILDFFSLAPGMSLSFHHLAIAFIEESVNATDFLNKCKNVYCESVCDEIEKLTRQQSGCKLWFELRYGRVTASKLAEVAACKTPDGSLVATIMGGRKVLPSEAMKRGSLLEEEVIKEVEKKVKNECEKSRVLPSP